MSAPTGRACWTTRCTSATATPGCRWPTYDAFLDAFVTAVRRLFPRALLHWEDIGVSNARRLLERYRATMLTFNDDIQGTGAVNLAAVIAAVRATGIKLSDHRIVIFGAGTAGIGIADQLSAALVADGLSAGQARARFWAIDRHGLLTSTDPGLSEQQRRYARDPADAADWARDPELGRVGEVGRGVGLAEVVRRVHPTILIGTSARTGAFSEAIVTEMAAHASRPVIMPMSNPTSLAEARPADLIRWTDGRALVAAGSPFGPVDFDGTRYVVGQANNALVFPGLGLGVIAAPRLAGHRRDAQRGRLRRGRPGGHHHPRGAAAAPGGGAARYLAGRGDRRGQGRRRRRRGRPPAGRRRHRAGPGPHVAAGLPPGADGLRVQGRARRVRVPAPHLGPPDRAAVRG